MKQPGGRIVILGGKESGAGAAVLAKQKGFEVFVSDKGNIEEKYRKVLLQNEIEFEEGNHTGDLILNANEIIKSPGIPDTSEIMVKIRENKIPVISEMEFAGRYAGGKIIGITGSAGKTTTTLLTYHILRSAGLDVALAGNIGNVTFMGQQTGGCLASVVANGTHDYYVVEISSFQLDDMHDFRVNIAVLTNITRNHLNRYDNDMQQYINSKFRITQNQTEDDLFIYCADDEITVKELEKREIKAEKIFFTLAPPVQKEMMPDGETGAYTENENLIIQYQKPINNQTTINKPFTMSIYTLALQGRHNLYDTMAAGIVARAFDIRKDVIRECLSDFQNIEHRLESVGKVHGIEFVNDSKATTVNSAWYALESVQSSVIWIAGGQDKGNDYSMLNEIVKQKVKAIVCLGKDNSKIKKAFRDLVPAIVETKSAREAVTVAYALGKKGDTVLLSPACASFDLFIDYEDRGRQFKEAVRSL